MQTGSASGVGGGGIAQRIEERFRLRVALVLAVNDLHGHVFERGFAGDAFEPARMCELLVVGEIEADEETQMQRVGGVGRLRGCGTLEAELELAAETEGLLPSVDAMTGLLGGVLVPAKIEYQIGLRHE